MFAEAIRQFDIIATETFLNDPELRRLILPVIRADFEMSAKYRYTPEPPWDIPITCLTGLRDTYVSPENARPGAASPTSASSSSWSTRSTFSSSTTTSS